jgi:hypothetical protein
MSRKKKRRAREGLESVAEALLVIGVRYRPDSGRTRQAARVVLEDLADELHSRPVYTIFTLITDAINERVDPLPPPGGGSAVVCQAIRREFPLSPEEFRKVGKLEGDPNRLGVPACTMPVKLLGLFVDL